jgi:hypothetical protein
MPSAKFETKINVAKKGRDFEVPIMKVVMNESRRENERTMIATSYKRKADRKSGGLLLLLLLDDVTIASGQWPGTWWHSSKQDARRAPKCFLLLLSLRQMPFTSQFRERPEIP